jgi:poly(3-hydroxybutyrate) depolymerase
MPQLVGLILLLSPSPTSPVDELQAWLSQKPEARKPLHELSFATTPLTRSLARDASELLWADLVRQVKAGHAQEWTDKRIKLGNLEMKFDYRIFGEKPAQGRSLFISMHGGGSAPARVNDRQWENQKRLYKPEEGVYLAPRAPNDAWNMWFQPHMDAFFERLILNAIVFADVNPNRVYLTGYSAGGDGVFRLAPRLADRWAAAAMMAGHPGESTPLNLRNLPFALHMGEKDAAYERNKRAAEWKQRLGDLRQQDPAGYVHDVVIHPGKGHWMDRQDAAAIPWMARYTRNTSPDKIVWHEAGSQSASFYWLALPPSSKPEKFMITATCKKQIISIECQNIFNLTIRLSDNLLDLDQPVTIQVNGKTRSEIKPKRTIATLAATLAERKDPGLMFSSQVEFQATAK